MSATNLMTYLRRLPHKKIEVVQSRQESKHGMEDDPMFVITGATGHTGNVVARTLLTKGEKVRYDPFDRRPS
jgi:hypothetical protein